MRLSRVWIAAVAALVTAAGARAADADDFLKPENWEGLKDIWKVDNGTVTGDTGAGITFNTFLCSKKKYKDFEMSFQVRLKDGKGNSGIQIRSKVVAPEDKFTVSGPQADIGEGYWGSLYGERFGGMMKEAPRDLVGAKLKKDDFNDYSIKCVGKKVTITVNGVVAVDQEFDKMPEDGIIAFQAHHRPRIGGRMIDGPERATYASGTSPPFPRNPPCAASRSPPHSCSASSRPSWPPKTRPASCPRVRSPTTPASASRSPSTATSPSRRPPPRTPGTPAGSRSANKSSSPRASGRCPRRRRSNR
jgi:hypothetical protein